jgi:hypothetical protein
MLVLDVCTKRPQTGKQSVNIVTSGQIGDLRCSTCSGIQDQGTMGDKLVAWYGYRAP